MQPRLDYTKASPHALKAMYALQAAVNNSVLEKPLVELVKLRASQINGSAFCIDMHLKEAKAAGQREQRLYLLDAARSTGVHRPRRAALAWTEALTLVSETHVPDEVYEELRQHFNETELANLTLAVVAINGWNRFSISFATAPGGARFVTNACPVGWASFVGPPTAAWWASFVGPPDESRWPHTAQSARRWRRAWRNAHVAQVAQEHAGPQRLAEIRQHLDRLHRSETADDARHGAEHGELAPPARRLGRVQARQARRPARNNRRDLHLQVVHRAVHAAAYPAARPRGSAATVRRTAGRNRRRDPPGRPAARRCPR